MPLRGNNSRNNATIWFLLLAEVRAKLYVLNKNMNMFETSKTNGPALLFVAFGTSLVLFKMFSSLENI